MVHFDLFETGFDPGSSRHPVSAPSASANQWIYLLHPLLNRALAALGELPAREAAEFVSRLEPLVKEKAQEIIFFHDGTERPVLHPKDKEQQKLYYSGQKKLHALKNIVLGQANGQVMFLSRTYEGKKHDKKVADQAGYQLPVGTSLYQDTGFQGFTLAGVTIMPPKKKPRGQELTAAEKETIRLFLKSGYGSLVGSNGIGLLRTSSEIGKTTSETKLWKPAVAYIISD